MPANLSPEYFEAERRYRDADDDRERLEALKSMLSSIPKHKGTEKMQADIKSRIAKIKLDIKRGGGKARRRDPSHIERGRRGPMCPTSKPRRL